MSKNNTSIDQVLFFIFRDHKILRVNISDTGLLTSSKLSRMNIHISTLLLRHKTINASH